MKMNKIFFVFVLAVFFVSSVSALDVNNYVTTGVEIGEHNTALQFSLVNPVAQNYDNQNIAFSISGGQLVVQGSDMPAFLNDLLSSYLPEGTSGTISFKVSDIVNGINFQTNFADGHTSPTFSNVAIDGTIPVTVSLSIPGGMSLTNLHTDLSSLLSLVHDSNPDSPLLADLNNPAFLESLVSPSPVAMVGAASFIKSGNDFTFTYNKGFGDLQQNFPNAVSYVEGVIGSAYSYSGNVQNLIDLSEFDLSGLISSNGIIVPFDYQSYLNSGFSVSADLSSLGNNLHNGVYSIPVALNDITANVGLTLSGIPTYATPYVPSDVSISNWVSQIANLPFGSNVVVVLKSASQVYDVGLNIHFLQAMEITVDQTTDGNVYFSVDKTSVSDKNKVSLYVLEDGIHWIKLNTVQLVDSGTKYNYLAYTPHFSTFMIGEDVTASHGGSGGGVRNVGDNAPVTTSNTPNEPTTTSPTSANPTPITGGIIGALTSTGGILALVFLVGITATLVAVKLVKKRRAA